MDAFPHRYEARALAGTEGGVAVATEGAPAIESAAPVQFGGPGGCWSPETLLVAAVADCFVLTFRAIARASKLEWSRIDCTAEGTLDRVDGVTRFTGMHLSARLVLPAGGDAERARRLLAKAETGCLVTSSLKLEPTLDAEVAVA